MMRTAISPLFATNSLWLVYSHDSRHYIYQHHVFKTSSIAPQALEFNGLALSARVSPVDREHHEPRKAVNVDRWSHIAEKNDKE